MFQTHSSHAFEGKATKVFRTKDLCGQCYLVYYIDTLSQLRLVKYNLGNDNTRLIFGAVSRMPAKDALPLEVTIHQIVFKLVEYYCLSFVGP